MKLKRSVDLKQFEKRMIEYRKVKLAKIEAIYGYVQVAPERELDRILTVILQLNKPKKEDSPSE